MSTPLAVYTIAHENGIDLSKYLSGDETAEVRRLLSELRAGGEAPRPREEAARSKRRPGLKREGQNRHRRRRHRHDLRP